MKKGKKPMTPTQLQEWRMRMGYSLTDMATALVCSRDLIKKMLNGQRGISARTERLVEMLTPRPPPRKRKRAA